MQIDITEEKRKEIFQKNLFFKLFDSVCQIETALNFARGGIWDLDDTEWPFQLAGTISPIKWNNDLYLITAKHVAQNMGLNHNQVMYYLPPDKYLSYDKTLNGDKNDNLKEDPCDDFVMLKIKEDDVYKEFEYVLKNSFMELNSNISFEDSLLDIYIRGCPNPMNFDGTKIDFDKQKISQQCFVTNGFLNVRESECSGCYYVKMKTPTVETFGGDPQGMSGSLVYGVNEKCNAGVLGLLIGYNTLSMEYLVLSSEMIFQRCEAFLKDCAAKL